MRKFLWGSAVLAAGVAGGVSTASAEDVNIALFVAIQANPVEQAIINAFQDVAKEDGNAKFVVFDSNNSVQKEIANCADAIASGKYQAFALKAVAGPPLISCAEKAIAAGIPVVAFGNALGPNPDTADRQIDGLTASVIELAKINGESLAKLVNEACQAKGTKPCKVGYMYGPVAFDWASVSRKNFLERAAADYPDITVVADSTYNFDQNQARALAKTMMQSHSDLDVIAADSDTGAKGIIAGLTDIGAAPGKDVLVTGGALSKQGKELIVSGQMFGSTCLMPITEAKTAAKYSIMAARGQMIDEPDYEVCERASPTGNDPLTAANADQFTPEW